ncbi:ubiquitin-like protein-specific isopeptidase [Branchiostoma belcheri]|nr:ubiquitin-like protein-specific isopeptidase [Branchiostoma belcheri]
MNSTRKRLFQPLEDRHQLPDISNRDRLAKSLRRAVPEAVLFTALEKQAHKENVESGQPLSPQHLFMDAMAKPYTQDSTTEFISSLVISKDDVAVLEKATRGQSSSPIWTMARRGRLTASNFYSIYTKVQSIKKRPGTSADALLGKLMGYSRTSETLTAIKYGREMEADAKQALFEVFDKEHQEACCEPVGIVLSEQRAFLGASPDAVLSCKCHGQRVAELKCPMSCKDTAPSPTILPYLYESSDGLKLKTNHGYYAQCQGQMALTGYKLCSFYVYSPHGSIHIPVKFNKTYWEEIRDALDYFFKEYVAPELLTGRLKRELDASASGEVATSSTNHNTPSTSSAVPGTADTSHDMMSGDPVWCEECQTRGKRRQLVLYQWSSDEACYMCQDDDCTFPMGCTDMFKYTIVRNSSDLVSQRRKKRKSSLPPVTQTNHVTAPTPPIICDVSPPSLSSGTFQAWKKPLPLKQGEGMTQSGASLSEQSDDIFSQGLANKDLMSMFSENSSALMGTACSPCDWDLDLDDIFPLGEGLVSPSQGKATSVRNNSLTTASEPENIAPHLCTDSQVDCVVKLAQNSVSGDSSTSNSKEIQKQHRQDGTVKLAQHFVPDSSMSQGIPTAAHSAIIDDLMSEEDCTIQWTNAHSLCWLDAAMCMLVHSQTLRHRLSQLNGNGEGTVKTLHLAYQQAQDLLSNYQKTRKTPEKLKFPKAALTPNSEELICVERATEILHDVRQKVFESLRPTLRCELGKNESPVFALPLLLRENWLIEDLFRMEYDWQFSCDKCGFTKSDRMTKVLPTFPSVTPAFSLLQAYHLRSCFSCGAPDQKRRMVFSRLPPFVMLHLVNGLSHNRLEDLDCTYQDRQYRLSAVIRYQTHPQHFVAYIRDTQGNRWLQCDDLSHPVCRWQDTPPSIPPSQIHIVSWELQSDDPTAAHTLPPFSVASRGSLLSDSGSSSIRGTRRNSTSSECSSLSSLQYNIDTVDLTTDVDLSGNLSSGSGSLSQGPAEGGVTDTAVNRLSGLAVQKGAVVSTSPTTSLQTTQSTQFRVGTAKVQPSTAKTNVARNLFTEKPPSPPRMCLAPLPIGKALSPKSQSSQDTKLEHVSSQPNLSKAAPILRSPNSAFTVYNGCGPKKCPQTLVPSSVSAPNTRSESTEKNPEDKKKTFTVDAYTRQIASSSKVRQGRGKVSKPNTIRHLTQNAAASSTKILNPSSQHRYLGKPSVVTPQQSYPAVRRNVAKDAEPNNTTDSVIRPTKRALSTGTGPRKRTKVSALRNSTSTAPSSPALSTVTQKSYPQTDKQKTLTVNSAASVSKRKISELLGNKKQFAGYQPRGTTSGNTLPDKRTKYVGQFSISNSQHALARLQGSQKGKTTSPGLQRMPAKSKAVTASINVAQAKQTSNQLIPSDTSSPLQEDRRGHNGTYEYNQIDAQMNTTLEKDVPNRTVPDNATSSKMACSQSNEQQSLQGSKKRLSETMSELCEKLGLPTNNVKMDSTVEDNFFDSFFDADQSMDDFEISPSKDVLCLVADDNVNDSEFCQKLSTIGNLPVDTGLATSPIKMSDSNHNRVARRLAVSTDVRESSFTINTSAPALVNKLSRTLPGSPATSQRKGQLPTVSQLLKQRTVQTK